MTKPAAHASPPAYRRKGTAASQPVFPTIAALTRKAMTRSKRRRRTFTYAHRQRLDRAAEHYLRKCYRTNTAARGSEFAAELGLTPEYVSWLATQVLGQSLRHYFRQKQLAYAAWLLRTLPPKITVEEIARRSAFGTARTLYRCFLKAYGTTPAAFRELKK